VVKVLEPNQTGDAWLLEAGHQLAVPQARDGDPLRVYIEETDENFTIGWARTYHTDGQAFVSEPTCRARTILDGPIRHVVEQTGS
jgi:hypothetical protein